MMDPYEQPAETWPRWRDVFIPLVEYTAQPYENIEDIFAGTGALGQRRANVLNRPFNIFQDLPFGLSLFCWWPIKAEPQIENQAYLVQNRWRLFEGASNDENLEVRFNSVVTDGVLRLELYQLHAILHEGDIRSILRLEEPELA